MNFNPGLNQLGFLIWNIASQNGAIENGKNSIQTLILGMDMRHFVSLVIKKIHTNDDSIKHADGWHWPSSMIVQYYRVRAR